MGYSLHQYALFLSGAEPPWSVSGTVTLTGAADLTTGVALTLSGTVTLTGAMILTTQIVLTSTALIEITGAATALRFRGTAGILALCGHPFMALANWKDPDSC